MSQNDYDAAISEFLRRNSVTRCPTVCVVPTHASVSDADRAALRRYTEARETARLEKSRNHRQMLANAPAAAAACILSALVARCSTLADGQHPFGGLGA